MMIIDEETQNNMEKLRKLQQSNNEPPKQTKNYLAN